MVPADTLPTTFVQCCNSCTLASYAIASYHFTRLNIYNFFLGYCKHFDIKASSDQDAERKYDVHFQKEWKTRNCSGYKIIKELHNNSSEQVFVQSRAMFGVEIIQDTTSCLHRIEDKLKIEEVLISITFVVNKQGVHSCCVGLDEQGFYMIETRRGPHTIGISRIKNIKALGDLRDSLLIIPNSTNQE